jgi:hypothetical protein
MALIDRCDDHLDYGGLFGRSVHGAVRIDSLGLPVHVARVRHPVPRQLGFSSFHHFASRPLRNVLRLVFNCIRHENETTCFRLDV